VSLRETLQKNPGVTVGVLLLVLAAAIGAIVMQTGRGGPGVATFERSVYFYDVATGDLFADSNAYLPPHVAPSGNEAVLAIVYACGDCDDDELRSIARLIKYTDDAKQKLTAAGNDVSAQLMDEVSMNGTMVALPPEDGEIQWFSSNSKPGMLISEHHLNRCPGGNLTICEP